MFVCANQHYAAGWRRGGQTQSILKLQNQIWGQMLQVDMSLLVVLLLVSHLVKVAKCSVIWEKYIVRIIRVVCVSSAILVTDTLNRLNARMLKR